MQFKARWDVSLESRGLRGQNEKCIRLLHGEESGLAQD